MTAATVRRIRVMRIVVVTIAVISPRRVVLMATPVRRVRTKASQRYSRAIVLLSQNEVFVPA